MNSFLVWWFLCGLAGATLICAQVNRMLDMKTTRGDVLWILLLSFGGAVTLGIIVVWMIILTLTNFCFCSSDFWSQPLFKDKD